MNEFPREEIKLALERLEINFAARGESPPVSLAEAGEYFETNHALHPKLSESLAGDVSDRFYAALMISVFDPETATDALNALRAESTPILVQDEVGFGSVKAEARFVAENILAGRGVGEGLVRTARELENWRGAAWIETRDRPSIMAPHLPAVASVMRMIADAPDEAAALAREIARSDSIAGKFFAATIFGVIDNAAQRALLDELRTESTELSVRTGDVAILVPARDIAAAMLEDRGVF